MYSSFVRPFFQPASTNLPAPALGVDRERLASTLEFHFSNPEPTNVDQRPKNVGRPRVGGMKIQRWPVDHPSSSLYALLQRIGRRREREVGWPKKVAQDSRKRWPTFRRANPLFNVFGKKTLVDRGWKNENPTFFGQRGRWQVGRRRLEKWPKRGITRPARSLFQP